MVNFEAFKSHPSDGNNMDDQMLFLNSRDGVTFWHSRTRKLSSRREYSPQNTYSSYFVYRRKCIARRLRDWQVGMLRGLPRRPHGVLIRFLLPKTIFTLPAMWFSGPKPRFLCIFIGKKLRERALSAQRSVAEN